jgi:hypothetical protein
VFGRTPRLPADLSPKLEREERVIAWARAEDSAIVVTNRGLWLPGADGRLGWHEIHKAVWAEGELTVTGAVFTPPVGSAPTASAGEAIPDDTDARDTDTNDIDDTETETDTEAPDSDAPDADAGAVDAGAPDPDGGSDAYVGSDPEGAPIAAGLVPDAGPGYSLASDAAPIRIPIAEPGAVPRRVRERVTASVAFTSLYPVPGGGGARVVARRVSGRDGLTWSVRLEGGAAQNQDNPVVRAAVDQLVSAAKASISAVD